MELIQCSIKYILLLQSCSVSLSVCLPALSCVSLSVCRPSAYLCCPVCLCPSVTCLPTCAVLCVSVRLSPVCLPVLSYPVLSCQICAQGSHRISKFHSISNVSHSIQPQRQNNHFYSNLKGQFTPKLKKRCFTSRKLCTSIMLLHRVL